MSPARGDDPGRGLVGWLESAAVHAVLLLSVAAALYPVLWVVALAFSGGQTPTPRLVPFPDAPTLDRVHEVVTSGHRAGATWLFWRQMLNTVLVSAGAAVTGIAIATPAAYALARLPFVGKQAGVRALLATQMFPAVASAVPLYLILDALGLLNTRSGLVVCYATTAVPFAIFQLRAAFEAIPIELEEAAMVDGATRWTAFVRVVLPAARPAIAVTGLFAFMSAYNEFILAATLLDREELFTMPVVLQRYIGEHSARWPAFAAGALIVSTPVMVLFYAVQRHLVAGLTAGAVKG